MQFSLSFHKSTFTDSLIWQFPFCSTTRLFHIPQTRNLPAKRKLQVREIATETNEVNFPRSARGFFMTRNYWEKRYGVTKPHPAHDGTWRHMTAHERHMNAHERHMNGTWTARAQHMNGTTTAHVRHMDSTWRHMDREREEETQLNKNEYVCIYIYNQFPF